MAISKPIKNKKIIEQIKQFYIKENKLRDLLLFSLAINTGLMLADLLKLNVKDVKNKKFLTLKNGVEYPLTEDLQNLINEVVKDKKLAEPLFESNYKKRIDRSSVYRCFKAVCNHLYLDDISVDSWRKTFGYHYYIEFKDLLFLNWYFGHINIKQTLDYIDVQESLGSMYKAGLEL